MRRRTPGDHPRSRGVYAEGQYCIHVRQGSSPLARGLRRRTLLGEPHPRIIPARAGFTGTRRPRAGRPRDHPRSRGVYVTRVTGNAPAEGSSPLARGLHQCLGVGVDDVGIIPARAGFTGRSTRCPSGRRDHPRSRGVYGPSGPWRTCPAGSSPLARGLRRLTRTGFVYRRIIPARAGFTGASGGLGDHGPDHPRSRGVYAYTDALRGVDAGSSPLARGLLVLAALALPAMGIIPARAGFTPRGERPDDRDQDHPRSRGVYAGSPCGRWRSFGSSPLARGLQQCSSGGCRGTRIIPARAGFTSVSGSSGASASGSSPLARGLRPRRDRGAHAPVDHPRSRGVYLAAYGGTHVTVGSSPLARGLPISEPASKTARRIIPARAGFTRSASPPRTDSWDHPRSRGVYSPHSARDGVFRGSSPLARGLHRRPHNEWSAGGIIPARAGFTAEHFPDRNDLVDHPRSRGVYLNDLLDPEQQFGSSPLARGLHTRGMGTRSLDGIIPARAGFTFSLPFRYLVSTDHPRSRGVYRTGSRRQSGGEGSSPLARGLLVGPHAGRGHQWIIPARAGFTFTFLSAPLAAHGSSPLARGLPAASLFSSSVIWIIPARAGFTGMDRCRSAADRDHPRSRGVYSAEL